MNIGQIQNFAFAHVMTSILIHYHKDKTAIIQRAFTIIEFDDSEYMDLLKAITDDNISVLSRT
jgi:hypothetical protein